MLTCVKPKFDELSYRQKWLSDEKTMAYNQKWGGTISFPEEKWESWYERWIINPDRKFYAYLYSEEEKDYVGEISFRYDESYDEIIASVIIDDAYRHHGYGKAGLSLLCDQANRMGYRSICDDIAIDNPSVSMFLKEGFYEVFRNDSIIMVRKELK